MLSKALFMKTFAEMLNLNSFPTSAKCTHVYYCVEMTILWKPETRIILQCQTTRHFQESLKLCVSVWDWQWYIYSNCIYHNSRQGWIKYYLYDQVAKVKESDNV